MVHEVEPLVDVVEAEAVGDEGVGVDVSGEVAVDEQRHLVELTRSHDRTGG